MHNFNNALKRNIKTKNYSKKKKKKPTQNGKILNFKSKLKNKKKCFNKKYLTGHSDLW